MGPDEETEEETEEETPEEEDAFDNSGQALEADVEEIFGGAED